VKGVQILVTGGAGFIGSHLAHDLVARGARVRVLDNFLTGRRENLKSLAGNPLLEVIEGDIRDLAAVTAAMRGVRYVFHEAALPSVPRSVEDPATSLGIGIQGTLNVLAAARAGGCERVVYASSSSVYGNTPALPKAESMLPTPLSPYAVSKLAGEHLCAVFTHVHRLPTVALRYFNVFGPRQDPASAYAAVVPRFITATLAGEPPVIYGDGEQTRDFTYIQDVIEANLAACAAPPEAWGLAYNIACGGRIGLLDLAGRIARLIGRTTTPPRYEAPRPGDVRDSQADISRAARLLGWRPAVTLDEGLARTIDYYRAL
jgi:nucleoside-diphosphate-sugar epimerase